LYKTTVAYAAIQRPAIVRDLLKAIFANNSQTGTVKFKPDLISSVGCPKEGRLNRRTS